MPVFKIHDVAHGQLITLSHNNQLWMWDCGANTENAPIDFANAEGNGVVDRLFITNYDQDHLRGLPNLLHSGDVTLLIRNKSVSGNDLRTIKTADGNPLTAAMLSMIDMTERYTPGTGTRHYPLIPGASYSIYYNDYPTQATDTNNLSVVTVLTVNGTKVVISGDLEKDGWQTLLNNSNIAEDLAGTHIFVASHHGRENGYHDDVMRIARPSCVVMSDHEVKYATQENMTARYAKHCTGVTLNGIERKVLTTRNDGSLTWSL